MTVLALSPEDRDVVVRAAEAGAFDDLFALWMSTLDGDEESLEVRLAERAAALAGVLVPVARGNRVWTDKVDGSAGEDPAWAAMGRRWSDGRNK